MKATNICITIFVTGGAIHMCPTVYSNSFLVSTKYIKGLKTNLEAYVERFIKILLR